MAIIHFCFHAELNDFLPSNRRNARFTRCFETSSSVKDAIEAQGVPHTEVGLILVNGHSVDFSYLVQPDDQIDVYSVAAAANTTHAVSVQPQALSIPRFVLDVHLGKLATSLRMLGFDTLYRNDYTDEELARISSSEQRILLTRDIGLLKRSAVTYGYYVRTTDPQQQLMEVLKRFNLKDTVTPFQRCLRCNGLLEPVDKAAIIDQLPLHPRQHIEKFHRCRQCGQVFWKGSHYERMRQFVEQVLA